MAVLIDDELLALATDDELDAYIEYLASEAGYTPHDDGPWVLQERQQVAEDALGGLDRELSHELLYGGAVGGGKTDFMLWHAYELCKRYPKFSVLYLRRSFPQLNRTVVLRSLERFDRNVCKYNKTEKTWHFTNGSRLEFGYMDVDTDVFNYLSAEYDLIEWDEITEFPTDLPYNYLFSRLRSSITKILRGYVPHVVCSTNPGGIGGAWVKQRFVDPAPPGTRFDLVDDDPDSDTYGHPYGTRMFIPSRLTDNRYIDPRNYRKQLRHLPKETREALEDGSWDVVEGQYFTEFNRALHVCKEFPIPPHWQRIRAVDFGFNAPWCCLWVAFDGDGDAWVYREAYRTELTPVQQCELILGMQRPGEKIDYTVIDPSTFSRTGVGAPVAKQYGDAGVPVIRGLNARVDGWVRLREFLRVQRYEPGPDGAQHARARLHIFEGCTNLVRTLPLLVHDAKKPEDLDTRGEDHAPDALRYAVMSRPRKIVKPERGPLTPEERMVDLFRRRQSERRGRGTDHPELGRI